MLTPEELLRISEGAEDIAEQLHQDILDQVVRRIVKRLERGDDYLLTARDKWQLEVLQEAGYLAEDIQKEIAKRTALQMQEIKEAFEEAGIRSDKYDAQIYEAAELSVKPLAQSPHLVRLMQRAYEKTMGEWVNFTGTMATSTQAAFISECDRAYNLVTSGAMSYTEAVKQAVERMSDFGTMVTYPSGHTDTIETATLRAVRTGVAQATADVTLARMEEMGWDIVLTSAHIGARVTDKNDFTNHYWWQGKFYSLSGNDARFPPFSVCGYGNVQGIEGANCRHSFGPGDGEHNPFEKYDSEENQKAYELSQRQRAQERRIRKTKRDTMTLKTSIDSATDEATRTKLTAEYQRKAVLLQKQNKAYNDFCEENNLKRRADRIGIAKWDRKQAAQARGAYKTVAAKANKLYNNGSTEANVQEYMRHIAAHGKMERHGIQFLKWIDANDAVVNVAVPKIVAERIHAQENRLLKTDRAGMTIDAAQTIANNAKLVVYQSDRKTLKFFSENGYAVINLDNELVTAVPQKWRKKYDKYLEVYNGASK